MKPFPHSLLTLALFAGVSLSSLEAAEFKIDADFPGGNIAEGQIEGDTVHLKPDQRDNKLPWFYWYFRVSNAGGRTLSFVFDKGHVGVRGPGVSLDKGVTWKWLGADVVQDGTFSYTFPAEADDVRFSVGMPYVRANLDRFLAKHQGNPLLEVGTLTKTPKGRDVVKIHIGKKGKKAPFVVGVTGRNHCSEMMASYTLEGIMEGALADDEAGRWLKENVEFLFVPFMDTDGVEDGDQGKNRAPHDHNRDYTEGSIYAEVIALKEYVPKWTAGRPVVFLDLHDPALKNDIHETIHLLEPEERDQAERLDRLTTHLQRDQQGPIIYGKGSTMRFGAGYNTSTVKPSPMCAGWARSLENSLLGCTMEIPYANASGHEVNEDSARELGRDIAVAIYKLLQEEAASQANK